MVCNEPKRKIKEINIKVFVFTFSLLYGILSLPQICPLQVDNNANCDGKEVLRVIIALIFFFMAH